MVVSGVAFITFDTKTSTPFHFATTLGWRLQFFGIVVVIGSIGCLFGTWLLFPISQSFDESLNVA